MCPPRGLPPLAKAALETWFGAMDGDAYPAANPARWFGKDPAFDATLRDAFGELLVAIAMDEDDEGPWLASAHGQLARILVLDQFTRNIYRGSAKMYALDDEALDLALLAIETGRDDELHPQERVFCYMPLMHAESVPLQRMCVRQFERLVAEASDAQHEAFAANLEYALLHLEVIERFGRFPHRNALLYRESTADELRFLMTPGSSF